MKTLHRRYAGVDVHSANVVACIRVMTKGKVQHEVRQFSASTRDLLALRDWFEDENACGHGGDRCVLEAGVGHIGREVHADPRQRRSCGATFRGARARLHEIFERHITKLSIGPPIHQEANTMFEVLFIYPRSWRATSRRGGSRSRMLSRALRWPSAAYGTCSTMPGNR
jgi:hypothetical protein